MSQLTIETKKSFHEEHEDFTQKAYSDETLMPDRYVLVLTNLCNLRCSFCFQKKDPRKEAMTLEQWHKVIDQVPDYSRITFTGGEPLIFKGFDELFERVAKVYDCNIISNGLLLTKEKIDFILSFPKFRVLSISIDNIGNTLRDVKPAQWEKLIEMLNYFVQRRDELGSSAVLDVKSVVLDENAEELFDMYKFFVEKMKVDTHTFQFLKGSPIQHADFMFEYDKIFDKSHAYVYKKFDTICEQLDKVRRYNNDHGKISFMHPDLIKLYGPTPITEIPKLNEADHCSANFQPCKFPWSSVHINVDGRLFPCLAVSMGNVKDESLKDIIHGETFRKFKKDIREMGSVEACNRCGWLRATS